jgi:hypothetical protein
MENQDGILRGIKTDVFATIINSPVFKEWVYVHDKSIYKNFVELCRSHSNSEAWRPASYIINQVDQTGKIDELLDMLEAKFPEAIAKRAGGGSKNGIKINQFCALAVSPAWQEWLYEFDRLIYGRFMTLLQESKSCSANEDAMISTLEDIEKAGKMEKLTEALESKFPHVLADRPTKSLATNTGTLEIKTDQFCSIATSSVWQNWLFGFDTRIYNEFVDSLRKSKSCMDNRNVMIAMLKKIEKTGRMNELSGFLREEFPHVVSGNKAEKIDIKQIFPNYSEGVLTFPRRKIICDGSGDPRRKLMEFIKNKISVDYIVSDNCGYVEFLEPHEQELIPKIPPENWLIKKYRDAR